MEFNTRHVIEQADFVQTADAKLTFASNPENDIVEGMEGIQALVDKLDEVEAGTLIVEPPLDEGQIQSYREQATTITGIGKRAMEALNSTDSSRGNRLGKLFKGIGLASKS